jgi:hypothetical protein
MRVDWARQSVVPECIPSYATRTKVLRRKHTSRRHDTHERIKRRFLRILQLFSTCLFTKAKNDLRHICLTRQQGLRSSKRQVSNPSFSAKCLATCQNLFSEEACAAYNIW